MNARVPELVGLFVATLPLPFTLALKEMRKPRDKTTLYLDDDYVRNPRQFAMALREHMDPHWDTAEKDLEVRLRRSEPVTFHQALDAPANANLPGIVLIRGLLDAAAGVTFQEVWVREGAVLAQNTTVRGFACDGDIRLGANSTVVRWIDTEHDAHIGPGCDLGMSATAVGTLSISPGCSFRRLWGKPIRTLGVRPVAPERGVDTALSIEDEVVWADDRLSIPPGTHISAGIVAHGQLRIGEGAVISGTVKADGEIVIGDSARISGNVIGRRSIQIGDGAHIYGNVFAERDVRVGSNVVVGHAQGSKTIYASGRVVLGPSTSIHGWVVAERGGSTTEA